MTKYFTIGMAGHIDHGKTTLTKALTGINTDRLKEERERKISIEPGFAPLFQEKDLAVSIIDVPGHERFIRQMIAGVAGIDLFILVISATEGIMPQTKEHLEILSLLGITDGMIVFTKMDQADEELFEIVQEDVRDQLKNYNLANMPIYEVDSLSGEGVSQLTNAIKDKLQTITKQESVSSFRLPIDQVFTIKGQGVIVRGTVYDGQVSVGDELTILPSEAAVRVRQIQRHGEQKEEAKKGQRAAVNVGGISHDDIKRGDVLVSDDYFSTSNRLDVVFYPLNDINHPIKQRQSVKVHIGTSEVMGRIIFFDRNEIIPESNITEIYCQIELEEDVVVARQDRFIVRRPTPVETIGGGWIIEVEAEKHRFGKETIEQLQRKKDGTPTERVVSLLEDRIVLSRDNIERLTSLSSDQLNEIDEVLFKVSDGVYTLQIIFSRVQAAIIDQMTTYHEKYPMRIGVNKAEIVSSLNKYPDSLVDLALEDLQRQNKIEIEKQYLSLYDVKPSLPTSWEKRLQGVEDKLIQQNLEVDWWNSLFTDSNIPEEIQKDFYYYLLETEKAYIFDKDKLISAEAVKEAKQKLQAGIKDEVFTLQQARDILKLTRKNLVPLLELFDELGYTTRIENKRKWL